MSDHDFEKQVQSKMEQLRLRPSDAVWTKVDKRIRRERRRRRVILWLPLLLLTIAAGGYFLFETNSDKNKFTASDLTSTQKNTEQTTSETTVASGNEAATQQPATKSQTPVLNETDQAGSQTSKAGSIPATPAITEAETPVIAEKKSAIEPDAPVSTTPDRNAQPKKLRTNPLDNHLSNAGRKSVDKHDATALTAGAGAKPANKPSRKPAATPDNNIAKNDKVISGATQDTTTTVVQPETETIAYLNPRPDQVIDTVSTAPQAPLLKSVAEVKKKTTKPQNIAKLPEPPKRKPSTWSFGVVAEGGASHISKGNPFSLLSKKNVEPEDIAQSSPAPPNSMTIGGPAGFTQVETPKPATLKMGVAWSAGGFAQKKISKRVSLSVGLQYSVFSVKTKVGQFQKESISVSNANYDQVISEFYQGRISSMTANQGLFTTSPGGPILKNYTNKYQFIELPLKIHWRVTNEEQLPIIVDGGFSISHLVGTNALHYDGHYDVYYKDFNYFNKTQAGITAGVNLELFSESNNPVWIGPTIKYQLSNLLKGDLSGGQHLWQFGVGAKVFLKK